MKKKKNIIIILITFLVIIGIGFFLVKILNDKNKLTIDERKWIDENINKVQNINVVNNVNIFGKNGLGIYYNFLDDFADFYEMEINPITFNLSDNQTGISLGVKTTLSSNDLIFYTDHYVLVSKNKELVSDLANLNITILNSDEAILKNFINKYNVVETKDELLTSLNNNSIVVPLIEYLDYVLENNYYINYHFSDAKIYYTLQKDDSILSSVLEKYYYKWQENFANYFNSLEFALFVDSLNLSEESIAKMQSVEYDYGFVNNSPYEVIMGGKYGGIVAVYLSKFSDFANVDFNFNKYKNFERFIKATQNKTIDLYFNYYNLNNEYQNTFGIPSSYVVVARRNNTDVISNINALKNNEVYVLENSLIYDYLNNLGFKLKTYKNQKELFKLNQKDVYIVMDKDSFDYYKNKNMKNYTIRTSGNLPKTYDFKVYNNPTLYTLLDKYMMVSDNNLIKIEGLNNHFETVKIGSILSSIAEYIIYLILVIIIIALLIIRKSRKIIIAKKIKKDDKLKFIDQLTSLKNRNFLNENISIWNNNTIYPQTIIVMDLNKIQEINDIEGYNEGDKQIKTAASILIKTQLDNSEIMRTDGNEFMIYLVGYSQKQVTNYVHKLNKELKKLPYPNGAVIGYSMILDDIKTIEDALNEAVDAVKKQKSE